MWRRQRGRWTRQRRTSYLLAGVAALTLWATCACVAVHWSERTQRPRVRLLRCPQRLRGGLLHSLRRANHSGLTGSGSRPSQGRSSAPRVGLRSSLCWRAAALASLRLGWNASKACRASPVPSFMATPRSRKRSRRGRSGTVDVRPARGASSHALSKSLQWAPNLFMNMRPIWSHRIF